MAMGIGDEVPRKDVIEGDRSVLASWRSWQEFGRRNMYLDQREILILVRISSLYTNCPQQS